MWYIINLNSIVGFLKKEFMDLDELYYPGDTGPFVSCITRAQAFETYAEAAAIRDRLPAGSRQPNALGVVKIDFPAFPAMHVNYETIQQHHRMSEAIARRQISASELIDVANQQVGLADLGGLTSREIWIIKIMAQLIEDERTV